MFMKNLNAAYNGRSDTNCAVFTSGSDYGKELKKNMREMFLQPTDSHYNKITMLEYQENTKTEEVLQIFPAKPDANNTFCCLRSHNMSRS